MEKNHRALDTGGGRDVKTGRDLGLERFQAQPKWEIPVNVIVRRAQLLSDMLTSDQRAIAQLRD